MAVQLHTFANSALDSQKLASSPSHFTTWDRTLVPILQRLAMSRATERWRKTTAHTRNKNVGCPAYSPVIILTELFHAVPSLTILLCIIINLKKTVLLTMISCKSSLQRPPPMVLSFKNIWIICWCLHTDCSLNFPDFFFTRIRLTFSQSERTSQILMYEYNMTYKTPPIFRFSWSENVGYHSFNEMMMTFYNLWRNTFATYWQMLQLMTEHLRNILANGY